MTPSTHQSAKFTMLITRVVGTHAVWTDCPAVGNMPVPEAELIYDASSDASAEMRVWDSGF